MQWKRFVRDGEITEFSALALGQRSGKESYIQSIAILLGYTTNLKRTISTKRILRSIWSGWPAPYLDSLPMAFTWPFTTKRPWISGYQLDRPRKRRTYPSIISVSPSHDLTHSWPGYHDNTVAGGITSGLKIFEALIKEADEEASIDEDVIRKWAKSAGAISYIASLVYSLSHQTASQNYPGYRMAGDSRRLREFYSLMSLSALTRVFKVCLWPPNSAWCRPYVFPTKTKRRRGRVFWGLSHFLFNRS